MANEKPVPPSNAETVAIATTNGQTAFSFDWRADAANQVHAVYRPAGLPERVLALGSDFSVQGLQNPAGGSILLIGFTANQDDVIYIYRETLIEREKSWQNEGDYKADLVNKEQDHIYMIMQENRRALRSNASAIAIEAAARIAGDEVLNNRIDSILGEVNGAADRAEAAANASSSSASSSQSAADRAEAAAAGVNLPPILPGDKGKSLVVNNDESGYVFEKISIGGYFDTKEQAEASIVSDDVTAIRLSGYYSAGFGGGLYKRVSSQPSHKGKLEMLNGSWWELSESKPNALQFGSPLDHTVNFVPFLNDAMDYAQAKELKAVHVTTRPDGKTYKIATTIFMRSNIDVVVEKGVVFDANSMTGTSIRWQGSFGEEINMNSLRNRGSDTISCATVHGATIGDLFLLISQRNALSVDAGQWQLGVGTAGAPYAYLCEWMRVAAVTNTVSFKTTSSRIFTNYFNDQATDPNSQRTRSTLRKAAPVRNSNWHGGEFIADCPASIFAVMDCAYNCHMHDAVVHRKQRFGSSFRFECSFECSFVNCVNYNDPALVWDYNVHHGRLNRFVNSGGSMDCEFRKCKDYLGAQSFDLAYYGADVTTAGYPLIVVRPRVIDCETIGSYEAATSHPGVWGEQWVNNKFTDCYSMGLMVRGRGALVFGNKIDSSSELKLDGFEAGYVSRGILFYGGYSKDALVTGNTITGFKSAFDFWDSPSTGAVFSDVSISISNNIIDRCGVGLTTAFSGTNPYNGYRAISYSDNMHTRMQSGIAKLGAYSAGVILENNKIIGELLNEASATGDLSVIETAVNCPGLVATGNKWMRPPGATEGGRTAWMVYVRNVTDTALFPEAVWKERSLIKDNYVNHLPTGSLFFVSDASYKQQIGTAS